MAGSATELGATKISRVNVLVVDDKVENLTALKAILDAPDLNILLARSGNEALSKTLDNPLACILLDVEMPVMGGLEVARILQEDPIFHSVPIIFMTAYRNDETDIFAGYRFGAVDYLLKPIQAPIVRSKVRIFAELFRRQLMNERLNAALEEVCHELRQVTKAAAHDLKEPVRSVVQDCQSLQKQLSGHQDAEVRDSLQSIIQGSKRIYALLDDFVHFLNVRHSSKREEPVDMKQVVKEVMTALSPRIKEEAAEVVMGELPNVRGNRAQLRLVITCLLDNALKFRDGRPLRIQIGSQTSTSETTFSVRDSGRGIESIFFETIFELFQRLDPKRGDVGSGTGLAISRKIIEGHRGRVWVNSTLGEGSTFYFSLPTA